MTSTTDAPSHDCLTDEEIALAAEPLSAEEQSGLDFKKLMGAGIRPPFSYVQYYWRRTAEAYYRRSPGRSAVATFDAFCQQIGGFQTGFRRVHLAHVIRTVRPGSIWEFGSGTSTLWIALLLRHLHERTGHKGHLVSLEQSPRWYEAIQAAFPDDLREYVDLRLERVRLSRFGNWRGIHFDVTPPQAIDLAYVDGPTRTRGDARSDFPYSPFSANLVQLHGLGTRIGMAVTDHRWPIYPLLNETLASSYDIRCSKWWRSIILTPRR
jgi:hypothetical protein